MFRCYLDVIYHKNWTTRDLIGDASNLDIVNLEGVRGVACTTDLDGEVVIYYFCCITWTLISGCIAETRVGTPDTSIVGLIIELVFCIVVVVNGAL